MKRECAMSSREMEEAKRIIEANLRVIKERQASIDRIDVGDFVELTYKDFGNRDEYDEIDRHFKVRLQKGQVVSKGTSFFTIHDADFNRKEVVNNYKVLCGEAVINGSKKI